MMQPRAFETGAASQLFSPSPHIQLCPRHACSAVLPPRQPFLLQPGQSPPTPGSPNAPCSITARRALPSVATPGWILALHPHCTGGQPSPCPSPDTCTDPCILIPQPEQLHAHDYLDIERCTARIHHPCVHCSLYLCIPSPRAPYVCDNTPQHWQPSPARCHAPYLGIIQKQQ